MAQAADLSEVVVEDGVLVARVAGITTARALRPFIKRVLKAAAANRARGVLVDLNRVDAPIEAVERMRLGNAVAENWPPTLRMAILHPPEHGYLDRLFEAPVSQRGIVAMVFTDRADALRWLAT